MINKDEAKEMLRFASNIQQKKDIAKQLKNAVSIENSTLTFSYNPTDWIWILVLLSTLFLIGFVLLKKEPSPPPPPSSTPFLGFKPTNPDPVPPI